jgi:hypothetical protein
MNIEFFLVSLPIWQLVLVFVVGSMLITGGLTWYITRHVPLQIHIENNILGGYIYQALIGIFSVLLAFVIMIVWQDFTEAKANAELEADHLEITYYVADKLPEPQRTEFKGTLFEYISEIIDHEWSLMAQGKHSEQANKLNRKMLSLSLSLNPLNYQDSVVLEKLGDEMEILSALRQKRLSDSRSCIEPALWIMLCVGGLALMGFALTFRSRNHNIQILMTVVLAGLLSFSLVLVLVLDLPFSGEIHVRNDIFVQVLNLIKSQ